MRVIITENHGALVLSSTYWGSELERAGKLYASVNAGTIRILLPAALRHYIQECRSAKYAILSRGPWPAQGLPEAVEILFEDESDSPFAIQLCPESFDALPAEPSPGKEWTVALWDLKKGVPHRALERPCRWRRVPKIPWLKPWEEAQ